MNVKLTKQALKFLEKQTGFTRKRLEKALLDLENGQGDICRIAEGRYRLKVYHYRILFEFEGDTIIVINIDSRGDVYKQRRN